MVLKDGDTFEVCDQKELELVLSRLEARAKGKEELVSSKRILSKEEKNREKVARDKGNSNALKEIMFRAEQEKRQHIRFV